MTVSQLLKASYRQLVGEDDPTNELLSHGLEVLNALLNEWSTHRWGTYKVTNEALTLSTSTGTYTIGSGGDLDTARPIRVLDGTFVRVSSTDYRVRVIPRNEYNGIAFKTLTGIPYNLYYEPEYPLGKLRIYPEPSSGYVLYLDSTKALAAYSTFAASLNLPPEYETALRFNVAIDWAPELSIQPSAVVAARASGSLKNLKRLHAQPLSNVNSQLFSSPLRDYDINGDVHY